MSGSLPILAAEPSLLFPMVALRPEAGRFGQSLMGTRSRFPSRTNLRVTISAKNIERRLGYNGRWRDARGFQNRFQLSRTDNRIHFRNVLLNLVAIALHQASGNNEFFGRSGSLEASHFEDGVDRLLLGRSEERRVGKE